MKNKNAFTLVEILIVVGVTMLIMVSIGGIMSGVFTSQNKNKNSDIVTQNGNWILNELKKNIINADGGIFNCINNNSIEITSVKDRETTLITCNQVNNKIASYSAQRNQTINLTNNQELKLTCGSEFVKCEVSNSRLSKVTFNFNLGAGIAGLMTETNKDFSIDITLRN